MYFQELSAVSNRFELCAFSLNLRPLGALIAEFGPSAPLALLSINILGPGPPRARPAAAGVLVYPAAGVRSSMAQFPAPKLQVPASRPQFPRKSPQLVGIPKDFYKGFR